MIVHGELDINKIADLIQKILQQRDYNSTVIVTVKEKEEDKTA